MLNGSVCLTDSSIYLDEILHDGKDCCLYSLKEMERLPEIAKELLADPDRMQAVADGGYELAKAGHTWAHRAKDLHKLVEE